MGVLLLTFSVPLVQLIRFALGSELYSHIVLIPIVSGYLIWSRRRPPPPLSPPARGWAVGLGAAGVALAAWRAAFVIGGRAMAPADALALSTSSLLLLFGALGAWFLGRSVLRGYRFPLLFLVFMIPFPAALEGWLETLLQHGSAAAAVGFFKLTGMPIHQIGMVLELPGFTLEVAPECSGIHSTLALFITSVLAAHIFLRSSWKQASLVLAVIPLALLRNGFRVCTIGTLCVRVSPAMIDSYIHHHGGPIFFALSLVPFLAFLWLLVRSERRGAAAQVPSPRST